MIEVFSLVKKYNKGFYALKDVSFKVKRGEITLLIGPNGAGKTTSIKILLGLIKADSGKVNLETKDIGYMPENDLGKNDWTVEKYLKFICKLRKYKNVDERLDKIIKEYFDEENRSKKIKKLSKGNRQKVKWIQAILTDPQVLVLDEPTSNLDPIGKKMMRDFIQREKENGKAILISTHMLDEMEKIGDQYIILDRGKVVDSGLVCERKEIGLEEYFQDILSKDNKI